MIKRICFAITIVGLLFLQGCKLYAHRGILPIKAVNEKGELLRNEDIKIKILCLNATTYEPRPNPVVVKTDDGGMAKLNFFIKICKRHPTLKIAINDSKNLISFKVNNNLEPCLLIILENNSKQFKNYQLIDQKNK